MYGKPTSAIVNAAMRNHADPIAPEASRPNPTYLVRTGNRIRQSERPSDPDNLDAEVAYRAYRKQTNKINNNKKLRQSTIKLWVEIHHARYSRFALLLKDRKKNTSFIRKCVMFIT